MIQKIVLIGMRGTGKSHFGSLIAQHLGWKHVDIDTMIEENEMKKIPEIVEQNGWDYFRDIEHQECQKLENAEKVVISTGGGAICYERNISPLKKNAYTVLLFSTLDDLVARLKRAKDRPALTTADTLEEEIKQLWNERKEVYTREADIIFTAKKVLPNAKKNVECNANILAKRIEKEL